MTVIKHDLSHGRWSAIPNAIADDSKIKANALALLTYCLCKPEQWQVRTAVVRARFNWGEFAFRSAARELSLAGYFRYRKYRNEQGQIKTEILVSPTPVAPDATNQRPVCDAEVEPHRAAVDRSPADRCPNQEENNKEENNNNNQAASAAQQQEVVVDFYLVESGLLELREVEELKIAALLTNAPQDFLDEVCNQIRHKGRKGEHGIKHPVRFLKMIARSKKPEFEYAADERERREARERFESRKTQAVPAQTAPRLEKGAPCPPEWAERIDQLLGRKNAK
jgi:hypothetical protein